MAAERISGVMRVPQQSDFRELVPREDAGIGEVRSSTLSENSVAVRMVEFLVERGVDCFFGVPGGPICPLFEALRLDERARLIESRHETHAAFAAVAYHQATGKVPAVVVTAGPGVTNAVTGIASASLEGTPMLVIAGDVAWASHGGRLAQDSGPEGLDIDQALSSVTRAQIRITNGKSALSQTMRALEVATNDEDPGPALIVLPIDKATQPAPDFTLVPARKRQAALCDRDAVRRSADWLSAARRPLLVIGGACRPHADLMARLVDALGVPFVTTPRGKGIVSEEHPLSLRNGGMAASMWARRYTAEPVDVALALGTDLDDTSIGPTPYMGVGGRLVHVDRNCAVIHRNFPTALGVSADLADFANALVAEAACNGREPSWPREALADVRRESAFDVPDFRTANDPRIAPHRAIADLEAAALPGTRFVTDIGEHMLFALHYLTARGPHGFHIQLNLGSMGSGICGAVGLALAQPHVPVICIAGDGGMQMVGMEILTAKKHRLPILYAVFNDGRYNMVHHGMRQIFGEADTYDTPRIDFSMWAAAMGIPARVIRWGGEIDRALVTELASDGPAVLDIRIDERVRVRGGGRVEALQHMSMASK